MKTKITKKIKTTLDPDSVLEIAQQEFTKLGKSRITEKQLLVGKADGVTTVGKFKLEILKREYGVSLDLSVDKSASVGTMILLCLLLVFSVFLIPLIFLIIHAVKLQGELRDPNNPPFEKALEAIKEECEFSSSAHSIDKP